MDGLRHRRLHREQGLPAELHHHGGEQGGGKASTPPQVCSGSGGILRDMAGVISSPRRPLEYPHGVDCRLVEPTQSMFGGDSNYMVAYLSIFIMFFSQMGGSRPPRACYPALLDVLPSGGQPKLHV